ncbi:MAG: PD-(D/E)XK nuclease family protein, partial [Planctomycetaceae bacterium]|nr:PD-(D/E)XK nuclease family protein [Planctomycetaceae bacterium]
MPVVYSHSRLSVFEACRLRYRLKYIDRVKRDVEGIEAFLGSRVHEALESLYREVMLGRIPSAEAVAGVFHRRWDEEWSDAVLVTSDRLRPADYRAAGEECLRRYAARHAPYRADQTLGVEVKIGVDLPGGARLEGFADRVARDPDGWISIHDYKTSARLPTQAEVDQDRQLALYQAGVERLWPGAPGVRLRWHYLRFDERLESVRSRERMEALLQDTAALVEAVESTREWTATPSALCAWCPYWDLCPEKRHDWLAGRAPHGGPAEAGSGEGLFDDHEEKDRASAAEAEEALA